MVKCHKFQKLSSKYLKGRQNMKKKVIRIIVWLLVIIWMGVIFAFSSMDSEKSNNTSKGLITKAIDKTEKVENKTTDNVENKKENQIEKEKNELVNKLNYPIRKCAHGTEYLILSILILIALINTNEKYKNNYKSALLITITMCFLYACSDEIHQLFVEERTSSFVDVLIDTLGALIGSLLFSLIYKKGDLLHEKKNY